MESSRIRPGAAGGGTFPTGGGSGRSRRSLVNTSGVPFADAALRAALLLEAAIRPDGTPLFPDAPSPAEVVGEVTDQRRSWFTMRPGPELAAVLDELEVSSLDDESLVEAARAHGRMIAHHEAALAQVLAELVTRPPYDAEPDPATNPRGAVGVAASEVSLAMSWTPSHADTQLSRAMSLVRELPATLEALSAGQIDAYKARVIEESTAPVADRPGLRAEAEAEALAVAETKTAPALRAHIKRTVTRLDPDGVQARQKQARDARRVDKPYPEEDGMAAMPIYGPVEDLAALFTAIDAAARARRDDLTRRGAIAGSDAAGHAAAGGGATPPMAALRFDVLADLAWAGLNAGHLGCCNPDCRGLKTRLGSHQGKAATVNVTVPASTLIGIDDQPAELAGYGPITAEVARRIAADASIRRWLTDPASGALLDYGTTRYDPPQHLRDHVIARDRTCRFPTCRWPARDSQLDHTVPHRRDGTGGATADHNLGPLHGRHHNNKTHHGFGVVQPEPGRFVITTPAGLTYHVDPEIIGPITEPAAQPTGRHQRTSEHPGGVIDQEIHVADTFDHDALDDHLLDEQIRDEQLLDAYTFDDW